MEKPTLATEEILSKRRGTTNGKLPKAIELAGDVFPDLVAEHFHSSAFAMPQNGALNTETRVLIYLAVALATDSKASIEAMMNKAKMQNISNEKILDAFKIARHAEATSVLGKAEILFEKFKNDLFGYLRSIREYSKNLIIHGDPGILKSRHLSFLKEAQ